MHYLDAVSTFVHQLRYEDIPPEVIERARLIVLDSMGVMLAGSGEPHIARALQAMRMRGSQGCSHFFPDCSAGDAADAGFINGIVICAHVAEEGHKYAKGHVAAYVLPAVLAVAEERQATGREFLTAFVAGYELCARLGMACKVREGMHPSGTWGTVACAAAVARLMGMPPAQIRESMNVAAPLTIAASWNAAEEGATVRDLYSASGGSGAVWAPRWVQAGITGSADDVSAVFGKITSAQFDSTKITDGLGSRWEILRNYFKLHACCRNFQSGIDVGLELRQAPGFELAAVKSIDVDTFALPVEHNASPRPHNVLAARESFPVSLALTLIHGRCDQSVFSMQHVSDSEVARLASLVRMRVDPELDRLLPEARPTRVTIGFADGRSVSGYAEVAAGDPMRPLTQDQLMAKFRRNAQVLGAGGAQALEAALVSLDKLGAIGELFAVMSDSRKSVTA